MIVNHHVKYKEIHGIDEVVQMNRSEHKTLHNRLRKEGKCNIPVNELAKISNQANKRARKSDPDSQNETITVLAPQNGRLEKTELSVHRGSMTILTPSEFQSLLASIPASKNQVRFKFQLETMLNTGMRYSELKAFSDHPEWFDTKNRLIALPAKATKTSKARDVHLTPQFASRLELFLSGNELKLPARQVMDENLERWYPHDISVKTFRKTWETWLLAVYQDRPLDVWMSQGHTGTVSLNHYYQSVGRLKAEMQAVKDYVIGWGT